MDARERLSRWSFSGFIDEREASACKSVEALIVKTISLELTKWFTRGGGERDRGSTRRRLPYQIEQMRNNWSNI